MLVQNLLSATMLLDMLCATCCAMLCFVVLAVQMYQQKFPIDQIEHEILQWVHRGGLLTRLKGSVDTTPTNHITAMKPGNPLQLINICNQLWSKTAAMVSKKHTK